MITDAEKIKAVYEKLSSDVNDKGWRVYHSPYMFICKLGFDKLVYDDLAIKLKADALAEHEKWFKVAYAYTQEIIAGLNDYALINPKVAKAVENQTLAFQPGFNKEKVAKNFYSNVEQYKRVQESKNESPISIKNE